jgi:hypothetical protein
MEGGEVLLGEGAACVAEIENLAFVDVAGAPA